MNEINMIIAETNRQSWIRRLGERRNNGVIGLNGFNSLIEKFGDSEDAVRGIN